MLVERYRSLHYCDQSQTTQICLTLPLEWLIPTGVDIFFIEYWIQFLHSWIFSKTAKGNWAIHTLLKRNPTKWFKCHYNLSCRWQFWSYTTSLKWHRVADKFALTVISTSINSDQSKVTIYPILIRLEISATAPAGNNLPLFLARYPMIPARDKHVAKDNNVPTL